MDNTFKNKMGYDNFIWWMGVIEAINDPLDLGRMKVRIFGWHTPNLSEMPTKTLPWASQLIAINASKSHSIPIVGDYVVGFFGDGESGQAPIVMGVLPGIKQKDGEKGVGFSEFANKYDKDPTNEIRPKSIADYAEFKVLKSTPTGTEPINIKVPGSKKNVVGKPSTPNVVQKYDPLGVIAATDEYRLHVCDVKNNILFKEATQKLDQYLEFLKSRFKSEGEALVGATSALVSQVLAAIKIIRYYISLIQEGLDFINEVFLQIANYLAYVRKMIQYILSLPAQLASLFAQCLQELYTALSGAVTKGIDSVTGTELFTEIKKLTSEGLALYTSAFSTYESGKAIVDEAKLLSDPKTYSLP